MHETSMGKDDTFSVSHHETHSGVVIQGEVVTWNLKAPWRRIAVNSDGLLHLKTSRSFPEPQGADFWIDTLVSSIAELQDQGMLALHTTLQPFSLGVRDSDEMLSPSSVAA